MYKPARIAPVMRTVEITLYVGDDLQEYLIADLMNLDFDGFEQEDFRLKAYIRAPRWDDAKREYVEQWLRARGIHEPVEERIVEEENWNRQWEETVQPVAVGSFLVKPTWADMPFEHADRMLLEIDPKMSFGTGYHESTRLMLRLLPEQVKAGERVLDVGTGTGILAVAAVKLGAGPVLAVDTDRWAQRNAVENFYLNRVEEQVTFRAGSLGVVPEGAFGLIMANINRNVLLGMLPLLAHKVRPGGRVVLSGLLRADRPDMLKAAADKGLTPVAEAEEGRWWAVAMERY